MTWAMMVFIVLAAALAQTWLPGMGWLGGAKCPFLMSAVLYYALGRRVSVMLVAAVAGGVMQDALSPIPFGYSAFCFVAIGLLAGAFRRLVLGESLTTQVIFGAAAAAALAMGLQLFLSGAGLLRWSFGQTVWKMAGTTLLGGVVTPLMFRAAAALDRLVGNVTEDEELRGKLDGFRWPA